MTAFTTWVNGLTDTYSVINGIIQQNASLLTEADTRIKTPYGSYPFDGTFGSYIPYWINARMFLTMNKVEAEIQRTLQPMINSGRATGLYIKINQLLPGAVYFTVNIYDNNQGNYQLNSNFTIT